jgi:hypothetical protein
LRTFRANKVGNINEIVGGPRREAQLHLSKRRNAASTSAADA